MDRKILFLLALVTVIWTGVAWFTSTGGKDSAPSPGEAAIKVDMNSADLRQIMLLPGLGEKTAQAIIDDRKTRGPFAKIEDLDRVKGIGPATIERISGYAVCR